MSTVVVGLDAVHVDEREADHDLLGLVRALPAGAARTAATHWATGGERPHVALSVEITGLEVALVVRLLRDRLSSLASRWALAADGRTLGDPALHAAAAAARRAHLERRSGRVVHFDGVEALVGTVPVAELVARSAVGRVRVLGGGEAPADAPVVTRGHVRPGWVDGELVLLTQPAVGGTLVPFESPTPTACCADH